MQIPAILPQITETNERLVMLDKAILLLNFLGQFNDANPKELSKEEATTYGSVLKFISKEFARGYRDIPLRELPQVMPGIGGSPQMVGAPLE